MRIAVIDDERPARGELKRQLSELIKNAEIWEADCAAEALKLLSERQFELIFLDIELGDMKGTQIVSALQKMQSAAKVIFVTAYSEYAVEAFELGVDDYVMKPFDSKRLKKVLDKCILPEKMESNKNNSLDRIAISNNGKLTVLSINDIVYIETCGRGCKVHTEKEEYLENRTLGEYEKMLPEQEFFRIHKSYLVRIDKIKEFFSWGNNCYGLHMWGFESEVLPVGREKMKAFKQLLGI